jgi:hypothetical protein
VAFAQTAPKPVSTFTAWNEGIAYLYNQSGSNSPTVGWGPNWDNVNGIDQEWSFNYDGNNYGFSGTFEFGMDNFGNQVINTLGTQGATISWFNTYYKFGKYVELQIGKLRDGTYRAPGWLIEGQSVTRIASAEFGPMLQITPIDGLNLGVFTQIPDGSQANYGKNLGLGVAYSMTDMFKATMTYRTIEGTSTSGTMTTGQIVNGGVSITAIKPVTIVVGAQSDYDAQTTNVYGSVGGSFVPSLTTNLDVSYVNRTGNAVVANKTAATSFAAEAQAEYAFGQYAAGVCFGYDDGNGNPLIGNNYAIYSNGGVFLFPYAVANFDNGSYVKLGVAYSSGKTGAENLDSLIQIPLIYVWSF